jgi:hypothetical protein
MLLIKNQTGTPREAMLPPNLLTIAEAVAVSVKPTKNNKELLLMMLCPQAL